MPLWIVLVFVALGLFAATSLFIVRRSRVSDAGTVSTGWIAKHQSSSSS